MDLTQAKTIFFQELSHIKDSRELEFIWKEILYYNYLTPSVDKGSGPKSLAHKLWDFIGRMKNHEPHQYILGGCYFYDIDLKVSPATLIPRPETEELVDLIIQQCDFEKPKVLDIGTGSGCIALSLAKHLKTPIGYAMDKSLEALQVARENAKTLALNVHFFQQDIVENMESSLEFDVIVSNPPYIPEREKSLMSSNVLDFEPEMALFVSNDDPLIFYRRIGEYGQLHLCERGKLYFECNEYNAYQVKSLLEQMNYKNVVVYQDLQGKDRMISAVK